MEAMFVLLGAAVAAPVAWGLSQARSRTSERTLRDELAAERLRAATSEARAEEAVRSRDLTIDSLRQEIDAGRATMEKAFGEASERALNGATERFLSLAKGEFEREQSRNRMRVEAEQEALRRMLDPMYQELDALERLTHESAKEHAAAMGTLRGQIEGISKTSESLANALKKPSVRGSWGEGQLVAILESSGLVAGKSFVVQDQTDAEGKVLRTDVVISLPRGRKIVIDSKTPLDQYLMAVDADTEEERTRRCLEHAKAVRGHVRDLQRKEYWTRYDGSPEYVILFMPYESAYQIACEHDRALLDDAQRARIILANPMTLMNLVHLATYVLNEERLQENAEQVRAHAKELCERLAKALEIMAKHGRHLRIAAESYNEMVGSVSSRLLPSANRVRDLGAGTDRPLVAPEVVDTAVRPFAPPEGALPGI